MERNRKNLLKDLSKRRGGKVLVYVTGDRPNLETVIHSEVVDKFLQHLDRIGNVKKIILVLHSKGGDITAAWSLTNLLRSFCDELEVIIPARAHSAATLISLGAERIIMTNGFLQLIEKEFKITGEEQKSEIMLKLMEKVHPLVLGNVYRTRNYIRILAKKLLEKHLQDSTQVDKIINFLCSESSSHDYTINRKEARDFLGLNIEKPDQDFYDSSIKPLYQDIQKELLLNEPFTPVNVGKLEQEQPYEFRRGLIQSLELGTDVFISKGTIIKRQIQTPQGLQLQMTDNISFEGWREEYEL